jgi:hypothetical protein
MLFLKDVTKGAKSVVGHIAAHQGNVTWIAHQGSMYRPAGNASLIFRESIRSCDTLGTFNRLELEGRC